MTRSYDSCSTRAHKRQKTYSLTDNNNNNGNDASVRLVRPSFPYCINGAHCRRKQSVNIEKDGKSQMWQPLSKEKTISKKPTCPFRLLFLLFLIAMIGAAGGVSRPGSNDCVTKLINGQKLTKCNHSQLRKIPPLVDSETIILSINHNYIDKLGW